MGESGDTTNRLQRRGFGPSSDAGAVKTLSAGRDFGPFSYRVRPNES